MDEQVKSSRLLTLLEKVYFYFSFHLPAIQFFISTWIKRFKDIYRSPPHISVVTGNIVIRIITIIRFAHYRLLLTSSSTFINDPMYLDTIQICRNLNEHYYYLISTTTVIWQIDASCSPFQSQNMLPFHIRLERLKLIC